MNRAKLQATSKSTRKTIEAVVDDILGMPNGDGTWYDIACNGGSIRVRKGLAAHDAAFVYAKDHQRDFVAKDKQSYQFKRDAVFYCHDFTAVRYALNVRGTQIFVLAVPDLLNGDGDAAWDAANDNAEELARIIAAAAPGYESEEKDAASTPQPSPRPSLEEFFLRVVPWPANPKDDGSSGYVNVHWTMRKNGEVYWPGKPARTVADFLKLTRWILARPHPGDIYFCTSLQRACAQNAQGRPKAVRNQENALALKAVWVDIDVKKPPKGYATIEEALEALDKFIAHYKLPAPTAVIASGNGIHAYWISTRVLSVDEWRPFAEGLKAAVLEFGLRCDTQVTVDCARILRVPGTYNCKTNPPKPVYIGLLQEEDIDFAADLKPLLDLAPAAKTNGSGAAATKKIETADAFKHLDPRHHLNDSIIDEYPPLPFPPIKAGCGWLRHVHDTGGRDQNQPLWWMALKCGIYLENGRALAHEFSNKYDGYTREKTDAKFDEVCKVKQEKDLGYPQCKTIHDSIPGGCTQCKSCPYWGKIKSPFNLAPQYQESAAVDIDKELEALGGRCPPEMRLPEGYAVDQKDRICAFTPTEVIGTKVVPARLLNILLTQIRDPSFQFKNGFYGLGFVASTERGSSSEVFLSALNCRQPQLIKYLAERFVQVVPGPETTALAEKFFLLGWTSCVRKTRPFAIKGPWDGAMKTAGGSASSVATRSITRTVRRCQSSLRPTMNSVPGTNRSARAMYGSPRPSF